MIRTIFILLVLWKVLIPSIEPYNNIDIEGNELSYTTCVGDKKYNIEKESGLEYLSNQVNCPQPIISSIPTIFCDGESTICISFDNDASEISYIRFFGSLYFPTSSNDPNQFCCDIDTRNSSCFPQTGELTLFYQCENGEDYTVLITDEAVIYPSAENIIPQLSYTPNACNPPLLEDPNCDVDVDVIHTLPTPDCDDPQMGTYEWSIEPAFDITDAPACFLDALSGIYEYPPCLEDCPCETNFVDITIDPFAAIDLCNNVYEICFEIETLVGNTGAGYYMVIEGSDGSTESLTIYEDDNKRIVSFPDPEGCNPVVLDLTASIFCSRNMTTLIQSDIDLGSITLYPDISLVLESPGCQQGEDGLSYLTKATFFNPDGEICSEQIVGTAGVVNGCDNTTDGTLQLDFVIFEGTPCERIYTDLVQVDCFDFTTGCTDPDACNYDPSAECDDGSCFTDPLCPKPVGMPNVICSGQGEICIEFDQEFNDVTIDNGFLYLPNNDFIRLITFSYEGNMLCFEYDLRSGLCNPVEGEVSIEYFCSNGTYTEFTFPGNYIVYPSVEAYAPQFAGNPIACQPYTLNFPPCGTVEYEEIIPGVNCDDPQNGSILWTNTPDYDTAIYPDCPVSFSGVLTIPPCLDNCPCEDVFCTMCSDLDLQLEIPDILCSDDNGYYDLLVSGLGSISEEYSIFIYINGVLMDTKNHQIGQSSTFLIQLDYENNTCYPIEEDVQYLVRCTFTDEIMYGGSLGSVTIYPNEENFTPVVIDGLDCEDDIMVLAPPCGSLIFDQDMISNKCDITEIESYEWEVALDFDVDSENNCLTNALSGVVSQDPCNQETGDECYSDCFGIGIVDDNCDCIYNNGVPMISYDGPTEFHICDSQSAVIELDISPIVGDDINLYVGNNSTVFDYTVLNSSTTTSPFTVFLNVQYIECNFGSTPLYAQISCRYDNSIIQSIYIGELYIYPAIFDYEIITLPADCTEIPDLLVIGCAELEITNVVAPVNNPNNPEDGYIEYMVYPNTNLSSTPLCYDYTLITGNVILESCFDPICDADNGTISIRKKED